jgi:cytoskeletal protein CcmA (bactofilin family)
MAEQNTGTDFTTVIGADVVIKGDVTVERGLRVDGQIDGSLTTKGKALIGKSGQLKAEIRAGTLIVEGRINGNITAERVQIEASAQVHGDLSAGKLTINEGATFSGKVQIGPEALKEASRPDTTIAGSTSRNATVGGQALKNVA